MDRRHDKHLRRERRKARQHRPGRPGPSPEAGLAELTPGLDEGPAEFLADCSNLWWLSTMEVEGPDTDQLVEMLIALPGRRSTAILTAFQSFATNQLQQRRIARVLADRHQVLPDWLIAHSEVRPVRTARQTEPYGDGDQYWIELAWPTGHTLSIGALVDAAWGLAFKDLILVPESIAAVEAMVSSPEAALLDGSGDPADMTQDYMTFEPIDAADVKAQITDALERSESFESTVETDMWPRMSPLLGWALGMLPEGGQGLPTYDLGAPQTRRIVEDFQASGEAPVDVEASVVEMWTHMFVQYSSQLDGDVHRWSPWKIEYLLTEWWRDVFPFSLDSMVDVPTVLAAFVRWSARQRPIPEPLLDVLLETIDRFEPAFLEWLGDAPDADDDGFSYDRNWLLDRAGGAQALPGLDAVPLPDEDFDEAGISADVLPAVRTALAGFEQELGSHGWAEAVELRTAGRRFLRQLALAAPEILLRRSSPGSNACTLAHVIYSLNWRMGKDGVVSRDLCRTFGLTSYPASRATAFRQAVTGHPYQGAAEFLTSPTRTTIIRYRDVLDGLWREEPPTDE